MAKVPNDVEALPKISSDRVRCTNVTDDRQTDGRATAYSEREREFTFTKNYNCVGTWATMWHRLHNRLNPFTQIISFYPMIIFVLRMGSFLVS